MSLPSRVRIRNSDSNVPTRLPLHSRHAAEQVAARKCQNPPPVRENGRLFCCPVFDEFREQNRIEMRATDLRSGVGDDGIDSHQVTSVSKRIGSNYRTFHFPRVSGTDGWTFAGYGVRGNAPTMGNPWS